MRRHLILCCPGKQCGPGIAFMKLPVLAFEVLREKMTAATPGIIKIMQVHFKGDPRWIPAMPDPALAVTSIPFDLLNKGATVKCVALNGKQYMAVYELIRVFTCKNLHESAMAWRRLDEDAKEELQPFLKTFTFSGISHTIICVEQVYQKDRPVSGQKSWSETGLSF